MSVEIHKWLQAGSFEIYFHFTPSLRSLFLVLSQCHTFVFFNNVISTKSSFPEGMNFYAQRTFLKHCTRFKKCWSPGSTRSKVANESIWHAEASSLHFSLDIRLLQVSLLLMRWLQLLNLNVQWCENRLQSDPEKTEFCPFIPKYIVYTGGHGRPLLCCCVVCRVHFLTWAASPLELADSLKFFDILHSVCISFFCFILFFFHCHPPFHYSPALFFFMKGSVDCLSRIFF